MIKQPKKQKDELQPTYPEYIFNKIVRATWDWNYFEFCEKLGYAEDMWSQEKFLAFREIGKQLTIITPSMLDMVYQAIMDNLEDA